MRRLVLGVLLAAAMAGHARAEPPVWVVRDSDSEMLIFGSVHLLPPGLAWKPARLTQGLAAADDLWFELPPGPDTQAKVSELAGARGVLPTGQSLFRLLSPAVSDQALRVAAAYGVDPLVLDRLEPWLAEIALAGAVYRKAGAAVENGVETSLEAAAPAQAVRRALETPAQQIAILDGAPRAEQIASFADTLRDIEENPRMFEVLVAAWMAGDIAAIDREALQTMRKATPSLFRRLVLERNAAWAGTLQQRLKGSGRTVVVVGVGHLVGEGSLPERLRALGYSVEGP